MKHCQCVFPSPTEEEVVTVPGEEPGSAWRVYVEPSPEGYVRIQQLAWNQGIGWYAQKSMVLPREVLTALVPQLRKALCLMPPARRGRADEGEAQPIPLLRLVSERADSPVEKCGG